MVWHRDLIWSFSKWITSWLSTIYCPNSIFSPSSLRLHSVQVCWAVCLLLGQYQILMSKSFILLPSKLSTPPFLALYSFLKLSWSYCTFTFSYTLSNQLVKVPWEKSCGNFVWDFIEGRNNIFRISVLPIREHGICLHLIKVLFVWFDF